MRVIVADDVLLMRVGICTVLGEAGYEVVAEANDAASAIAAAIEHEPDVAIIDIRMPPTHTDEGLVAARTIRECLPRTAVLVLSQYVEPEYALTLLEDYPERTGYLLKERVVNEAMFIDSVQRLVDGECVVDPSIVAQLMRRRRTRGPLDSLTDREREVLAQLAQGRSNAGIARALAISERTVESHTTQIFMKLDLEEEPERNRRVLAVLAYLGRRSDSEQ